MKNVPMLLAATAILMLSACQPPETSNLGGSDASNGVDAGTPPAETPEETAAPEPTLDELRQESCLSTAGVFLQASDFTSAETSIVNATRIQITGQVNSIDSGISPDFTAVCIFDADDSDSLSNIVVNGSRLSPDVLPRDAAAPGKIVPISDVQRRQLTTMSPEGSISKYFARMTFDLEGTDQPQCLAVSHLSPSEAEDSLFAALPDSDWVVIDLPEGPEAMTTVTSFRLQGDNKASVRLRHRENVAISGFGAMACE